ncbi:unnamed protein product [Timema podura]|uniref:Uncharacterized protein n=1 Tax=Timema podura TaxID=61482 RepID=A0ABN7PAP7_TIMPD|nr:unnamed protein product [Timema podura]
MGAWRYSPNICSADKLFNECPSDVLNRCSAGGASTSYHEGPLWYSTGTPDRDSNLDLPVIGSLVYCESGSALDNAVT